MPWHRDRSFLLHLLPPFILELTPKILSQTPSRQQLQQSPTSLFSQAPFLKKQTPQKEFQETSETCCTSRPMTDPFNSQTNTQCPMLQLRKSTPFSRLGLKLTIPRIQPMTCSRPTTTRRLQRQKLDRQTLSDLLCKPPLSCQRDLASQMYPLSMMDSRFSLELLLS